MKSVLPAFVLFLIIISLTLFFDSDSTPPTPPGGTGGAVEFPNSQQSSITATNPDMISGLDDFTIETFYKSNEGSSSDEVTIICLYNKNQLVEAKLIGSPTIQRDLHFFVEGLSIGSFAIPSLKLTDWHHVAIVCHSATYTLYFDGNAVITHSPIINIIASATTMEIGGNFSTGTGFFVGLQSNPRYSNFAQYTANFSIPSIPLSGVDTCALLLFTDQQHLLTDSSDVVGTTVKQQGNSTPLTVSQVTISF